MFDSLIYSIPYLIVVSLYALLSVSEYFNRNLKLTKGTYLFLCSSLFLLFFGLRGLIGWDWTNYYRYYEEVPSLNSDLIYFLNNFRLEPGIFVIMSLTKTIFNSFFFFTFVNTLIDVILINVILKRYSQNISFGYLVFIVMGGFYLETDLIRNAKSIFIFILSVRFIHERKLVLFVLYNFIGILFHFSSVFFLPLYFLANKVISRRIFIILFILGNIIFLFQIEYIKPILFQLLKMQSNNNASMWLNYFDNDVLSSSYGITIGYFERTLMALLVIFKYKQLVVSRLYNKFFINLFILYFISFYFFSEMKVIPVRIGGLFICSYWILVPGLVEEIRIRFNKLLFLLYFYLYSFIKIWGITNSVLFNYDNTLFRTQSIEERYRIFNSFEEK